MPRAQRRLSPPRRGAPSLHRGSMYAASWISDGLGGDVDDVRWIGIKKAQGLHASERAIFIDCRERSDYGGGTIPGAYHVPMSAVMRYGIVNVLGTDLIHLILSKKRHALIVVYSNVATPFSRCRAFARWMLRAGHSTLPAARFRRLRGGIFGWEKRGGNVRAAFRALFSCVPVPIDASRRLFGRTREPAACDTGVTGAWQRCGVHQRRLGGAAQECPGAQGPRNGRRRLMRVWIRVRVYVFVAALRTRGASSPCAPVDCGVPHAAAVVARGETGGVCRVCACPAARRMGHPRSRSRGMGLVSLPLGARESVCVTPLFFSVVIRGS
eukprot:7207014-Prymnesium_polylepis.1